MRHSPKYFSQMTFAIVVLCLSATFAKAQLDTTETAFKADSVIEYLTPLEYAFMMHEKTRFMLRLPAVGVGAEVEVLPYFTLMGQAYFTLMKQVYFPHAVTGNTRTLNLDAEMRWYYGSRKIGVRNMSGNYFALGYKNQILKSQLIAASYRESFFYGKWGVQRRFLENGFIDFGINAGFVKKPEYGDRKNNGFFIQSTGQVGLGVVFNKEKALDTERLCPVVKCYEKETFLLKLNTSDLFSFYRATTINNSSITIRPQIAIEQKIFDTPLSLQIDGKLEYDWWETELYTEPTVREIIKRNSGFLSARAQVRYYYNLKNRIRKGKSGNGLSANYISGGYYNQFEKDNHSNSFKPIFSGIMLTTGVQRTFGEHFFFDVEFGGALDKNGKYNDFILYGNIQLGIKF